MNVRLPSEARHNVTASDRNSALYFEGLSCGSTPSWTIKIHCQVCPHHGGRLSAGLAYCVALAGFGTARDADLLAAYLDRYLCRPDLAYDQTVAMGALLFIDLNLKGDQAARFLGPGGLWQQWLQDASHMQANSDSTPSCLSLIRGRCAFVDECAETR
nr:DUF6000 family protein [Streptomyces atratus]